MIWFVASPICGSLWLRKPAPADFDRWLNSATQCSLFSGEVVAQRLLYRCAIARAQKREKAEVKLHFADPVGMPVPVAAELDEELGGEIVPDAEQERVV